MAAFYFGDSPLNKHQSLEQIVERMIRELYKDSPDAEVVGVQIFLDGMGTHNFDIVIGTKKLPVSYVATSNKNMPGWVRLVCGQGNLESYPAHQRRENTVEALRKLPNQSDLDLL